MSSIPLSAHQISTKEVTKVSAKSVGVPWYLWCGVLAITSASIGGAWDVSWHRSIGRDTFWTPAHMAIYACGVLAAIACGYLVLFTTFRKPAALVEIGRASCRERVCMLV